MNKIVLLLLLLAFFAYDMAHTEAQASPLTASVVASPHTEFPEENHITTDYIEQQFKVLHEEMEENVSERAQGGAFDKKECKSSVSITEPHENDVIDVDTEVKIEFEAYTEDASFSLYLNGDKIGTGEIGDFKYIIRPDELSDGEHEIKIRLYDEDCTDSDSVTFIVKRHYCGDGICDLGESCRTCPNDCFCIPICRPIACMPQDNLCLSRGDDVLKRDITGNDFCAPE